MSNQLYTVSNSECTFNKRSSLANGSLAKAPGVARGLILIFRVVVYRPAKLRAGLAAIRIEEVETENMVFEFSGIGGIKVFVRV